MIKLTRSKLLLLGLLSIFVLGVAGFIFVMPSEKQSVLSFAEQLFTNQKYKRYNIIWTHLDEPSKQIYGGVDAYEKFWKALLGALSEKALKDFEIDKEHITRRAEWTSPQGITYNDVYEMPVQQTSNDGTTESTTQYIFKVGGEWKVTTSLTKDEYEETRGLLEEEGKL